MSGKSRSHSPAAQGARDTGSPTLPLAPTVQQQSYVSVVSGVAPTHTLEGKVRCVEPVDHGRMVWTGEADGAVHIRSLPSGNETRVLERRFKTFVNAMTFVEEANTVWVGHSDGFIRVHDAGSGDLVKELIHHDGPVYSMLAHEGFVYSGGADWKVFQWKPSSMEYSRMYTGHKNNVRDLAATQTAAVGGPDGDVEGGQQSASKGWIFSASDDGTIKAWDPHAPSYGEAFAEAEKQEKHAPTAGGLDRSGSPTTAEAAAATTALGVPCMHTFRGHTKSVLAVATVDAKGQLWSGSEDNTIRVWDTEGLDCRHILDSQHKAPVTSLTVVDDRIWSGAKDGVMYVWDTKTCSPIHTMSSGLQVSSQYIQCVRRLHRSYIWKVWSCSSEGTIQCWNAERAPTAAELDAAQGDKQQLSKEEQHLNAQRVKNLQAALYENVSKMKAKDDHIREMEHRLDILTGDPNKMSPEQEEIEALNTQLDDAYSEQELLRKDCDSVREQCQAAESVMAMTKTTLGQTAKELDETLEENEQLSAKAESATKELSTVTTQRDEAATQRDQLSAERDDLIKERDALVVQVNEQEELLKDQLKVQEEAQQLQDAHDALKAEHEGLQKTREEERSAEAAATGTETEDAATSPRRQSTPTAHEEDQTKKIVALQEENERLTKNNRQLEEDVERLQTDYAAVVKENSRGTSPVQPPPPTEATSTTSTAALEKKLADLQAEYDEYRHHSEACQLELEKHNDQLRDLNALGDADLAAAKQQVVDLRQEKMKLLTDLAKAHDEAQSSDTVAGVERGTASAQRDQDKQLIAILQDDREKLASRNESLEVEILTVNGKLKDQEEELLLLMKSSGSELPPAAEDKGSVESAKRCRELESQLKKEQDDKKRLEKKVQLGSDALDKFKQEQATMVKQHEVERAEYQELLRTRDEGTKKDRSAVAGGDAPVAASVAPTEEETNRSSGLPPATSTSRGGITASSSSEPTQETTQEQKQKEEEHRATVEKLETNVAAAEDKATKSEERAVKAEEAAAKAETKATHAEEKAARSEEKATRAEEKASKSDEQCREQQTRAQTADEEAVKANHRATQAENKLELEKERLAMGGERTHMADDRANNAEKKLATAEDKVHSLEQKLGVAEEKQKAATDQCSRAEERSQQVEEKCKTTEEKLTSAEQRAVLAEEKLRLTEVNARAAEERSSTGEKSAKSAEEKVVLAEQLRALAEEQAKVANEKCAASDLRAATAEEKHQIVTEKLSAAEQKAAITEEKLKGAVEKSSHAEARAATAEERAKTAEERTSHLEMSQVVQEEKLKSAQEKAASAEYRAVKAEDKASSSEERAVTAERRTAQLEEKTRSATDKVTGSEDKAFAAEERVRSAGQAQASAEDRATRSDQKLAAADARIEEMERTRQQREKNFEALDERVRSAEHKAAVTEQKLEGSTKSNEDHQKKLEERDQTNSTLEQKLAACEARLEESKAANTAKGKELEAEIQRHHDELEELKGQHSEAARNQDRKFADCDAEKNDSLRTIDRYMQQIEDLNQRVAELTQSHKDAQVKIDEQQSLVADHKKDIGRLEERSTRLDEVEKESAAQKEKIESLGANLTQCTTERDEAREMSNQLDSAHQDLQTKFGLLEKKQKETEEQRADLQRQLEVLAAQHEESVKHHEEAAAAKAQLEADHKALQEKKSALEQEVSALTERLKRIDVLEAELEGEKKQHQELKTVTLPEIEEGYQQRINTLDENNAQLLDLSNKANTTMAAQLDTINGLNQRIAQLETEMVNTTERCNQSEQEVAALKTTVARLNEDVATEKKNFSALERAKNRVDAKQQETSEELVKTQTRLEDTQTELAHSHEERSNLQEELKATQDQCEGLRGDLAKSIADGEAKAEIVNSLKQVIDERNQSISTLNDNLKANSEELTDTKTHLAETQMQLTETQSRLDAMTQRKEALEKELESFHRMAETLAERDYLIEQQKQDILERDGKITDLKERIPPLEKQIADLEVKEREAEGLQEKLTSTQQELSRMTTEVEDLSRQRDGFESDAQEGKSFVRQASELRVRVSELEAETQRLRNEALEANDAAREKESALEANLRSLQIDNVSLAKEQIELITRAKAAEDGASALGEVREHLLQARHNNEVLSQDLKAAQEEVHGLEARLAQYGPTGQVNHEQQVKELESLLCEKSDLLGEQAKTIDQLQGAHQEDASLIETLLNVGNAVAEENAHREMASFNAKIESLDSALDRSERYEKHQEREVLELSSRVEMLENALTTAVPMGGMAGGGGGRREEEAPSSPLTMHHSPGNSMRRSVNSSAAAMVSYQDGTASVSGSPYPHAAGTGPKVSSFIAVKSYVEHLSRLVSRKGEMIRELRQSLDERGDVLSTLRKKVAGLAVAANSGNGALTNAQAEGGGQDWTPIVTAELKTQLSLARRSNDYLQFEAGRLQRMCDAMTLARQQQAEANNQGEASTSADQLFSPQTRSLLEHYANTMRELREQIETGRSKERHLHQVIASQAKQLMAAEVLGEAETDALESRKRLLHVAEQGARSLAAAQAKMTALTDALVRAEEAAIPAMLTEAAAKRAVVVVDGNEGLSSAAHSDQPQQRLLPLLDLVEERDRLLAEAQEKASSLADEVASLNTKIEQQAEDSATLKRTVEEQEYALARIEGKMTTSSEELNESRQKREILKEQLTQVHGELETYETKEKELSIWLRANNYDISAQFDSQHQSTETVSAAAGGQEEGQQEGSSAENHVAIMSAAVFQDHKAKLRELHFKYEDAAYRLTEVEKQLVRTEKQLTDSQGEVHDLQDVVNLQKSDVTSANDAKEDADLEVKKVRLELREATEDLKKTSAQLQATRDDADEVLTERDQLLVEAKDLVEDLTATKEQLQASETKVSDSSNKLALVDEQLSAQSAELESKRNFIRDMEQTNLATRQNFDRREEVIKGIEEQATTLQRKNEELSTRVHTLQKEKGVLAEKFKGEEEGHASTKTRLENHIAELEENHEPLRDQASKANEAVEEKGRRVFDLEFELAQVKSDSQSVAKQCAFANETVRQQNAKIEALEQVTSDNSFKAVRDDELTRALVRLCTTFGLKPTGRETEPAEFITLLSGWEDIEVDRLLKLNGLVESLNELLTRFPTIVEHHHGATPSRDRSPTRAADDSTEVALGGSPTAAGTTQGGWSSSYRARMAHAFHRLEGAFAKVNASATKTIKAHEEEKHKAQSRQLKITEMITQGRAEKERWMETREQLDYLVNHLQDYDLVFHKNLRPLLVRRVSEMKTSFWTMSKKLSAGGSTVKFLSEALRSHSYETALERCQEFVDLYNGLSRQADAGGYLVDMVVAQCLTPEEKEDLGAIRQVREDVPSHYALASQSKPLVMDYQREEPARGGGGSQEHPQEDDVQTQYQQPEQGGVTSQTQVEDDEGGVSPPVVAYTPPPGQQGGASTNQAPPSSAVNDFALGK